MSIDIHNEELISLADAVGLIPKRRGGRKCHVSTIYRWCQHGHNGIKLEYVQLAGTRCTSREALIRFFERITDSVNSADTTAVRTPSQRMRYSEKAGKELEALGV